MADSSDSQFFVTKESQEKGSKHKESYAGLRDLSDIQKFTEADIVGPQGTIRGIKNRVRAGLATFENRGVTAKSNDEQGRIVVYTTSFKGVRSTYEDCRYVLTVFHNLRVRAEERDVYIHKFYNRELGERVGREDVSRLPQVYISGQHIGSKAEIEVLNETGGLRQLLANIPRQESSANCRMCGGYEFIPCRKCHGSKNSTANTFTSEFRALKCTYCSENGMEPCPACEGRRVTSLEEKAEMEAKKKEEERRELQEKERLEMEKRERIKQEALEADRLQQLERQKRLEEKQKKKERAKLEKERKKRAAIVREKLNEDIAKELERERQWQTEHEPPAAEGQLSGGESINETTVERDSGEHTSLAEGQDMAETTEVEEQTSIDIVDDTTCSEQPTLEPLEGVDDITVASDNITTEPVEVTTLF